MLYHGHIRHLTYFLITDADGSRISIAMVRICDSVCLSVCLHVKTKAAETGTGIEFIMIPRQPMNITSKCQRSRSQGVKCKKNI